MANDYFQFRQFVVRQGHCAMKVGTDGTLLGAWADLPIHSHPLPSIPITAHPLILDIGTGTGLIALMMAQRFPHARIVGVDIDGEAVSQARENVAASPFADRITIQEGDAVTMPAGATPYSAIVCNPPYFVDALQAPDERRTMARHATTLTYADLLSTARRLLADDGMLSVVIPFDCRQRFDAEASLAGFFKVRECAVRTTPRKLPRRYLLAYALHPAAPELTTGIIEEHPGVRSDWYQQLTKDFYL
jgi:tRNA1Val (adenine37-N6)-methyltransferase